MFHICYELEKINIEKIKNAEKQIRLFNILPLRNNIIPKNICIDKKIDLNNICYI